MAVTHSVYHRPFLRSDSINPSLFMVVVIGGTAAPVCCWFERSRLPQLYNWTWSELAWKTL